MGVNAREIVLDILLALEREEDYSHRLIKAVLDKYDYLEGREKAFATALAEALNSTGRVTSWNSTAVAKAQMPI
mgnify:CR=1 FL=1